MMKRLIKNTAGLGSDYFSPSDLNVQSGIDGFIITMKKKLFMKMILIMVIISL